VLAICCFLLKVFK